MADITDLKRKLLLGALAVNERPTDKVLTEAAEELVKKASVTEGDLREVGRKTAANERIFAASDLEDINNILDQLRRDR